MAAIFWLKYLPQRTVKGENTIGVVNKTENWYIATVLFIPFVIDKRHLSRPPEIFEVTDNSLVVKYHFSTECDWKN